MKSLTNMKQRNEEQLDKLLKKIVKEIGPEIPPVDFTSHVMIQVKSMKPLTAVTYRPLISKTGWFMIVTALISLISYVVANANSSRLVWHSPLDLNKPFEKTITAFSSIHFSHITFYAVVFSSILLLFQLKLLMNRYNKSMGW